MEDGKKLKVQKTCFGYFFFQNWQICMNFIFKRNGFESHKESKCIGIWSKFVNIIFKGKIKYHLHFLKNAWIMSEYISSSDNGSFMHVVKQY